MAAGAYIVACGITRSRTVALTGGSGAGSMLASNPVSGRRGRSSFGGVATNAAQQRSTVGTVGIRPSRISATLPR